MGGGEGHGGVNVRTVEASGWLEPTAAVCVSLMTHCVVTSSVDRGWGRGVNGGWGGARERQHEYGGGEWLVGADGRGVRLLDDPLRRHVLCGHEGDRGVNGGWGGARGATTWGRGVDRWLESSQGVLDIIVGMGWAQGASTWVWSPSAPPGGLPSTCSLRFAPFAPRRAPAGGRGAWAAGSCSSVLR